MLSQDQIDAFTEETDSTRDQNTGGAGAQNGPLLWRVLVACVRLTLGCWRMVLRAVTRRRAPGFP